MTAKDPNEKTGRLSMDKAGLQAFLRDRVELFQRDVRAIAEDDAVFGPSMGKLIRRKGYDTGSRSDQDRFNGEFPLMLGHMVKSGHLHEHGVNLNGAIRTSAEQLTGIYDEQSKLFKDLVDNLQSSIDELFDTQSGNLVGISGQDFLDMFEDVNERLAGGQGGGGGKKD
ncbi:type VII secretion system-associated protein [Streptomyces clavuligerus]|uniref:Type VII secretion system-associated protein n=1 Tax=Streptomyces clavuligerus TaxID=1901 RepID=B5H2D2_STRCL|nr:type VII secretion system-associated protein [Streptomyces clavuligerus]ANW21396.1 hypothetical protein BB341_25895 [Streptomyces clavuligerus]AXU16028.1 type VII secretion system-associated protein [Streptomyces clavuligerus]EDY52728.1 hypothetical protein SSCG_05756 [Streptomyces clavuligerus]EFG05457.1 Hypothetical protein SCLAV_0381 [Streptomyces clavuligerus]MBY6306163.1 type VII secretion system-associated protein [Streptomyces clavuligerus]